ncbi:MAG: lytic transglycosylase domain-containing protein [Polyangiaceae bacterium]|nr:lytic transglycosylase domain-containing protein [Polyangiaceae bacterium]
MQLLRAAALAALVSCAPASPNETGTRPPTPPVNGSAAPPAAAAAGPSRAPDGPVLDLSGVRPLIEDTRFSKAAAKLKLGKHAEAATLVLEVLGEKGTVDDAETRGVAAYLAASLYDRAGLVGQARLAYKRATEDGSPTRDVALLRLTEMAARAGNHDEAVKFAKTIDMKVVSKARVDDAIVESLVRIGEIEEARGRYAGLIDGTQRPYGWTRVALRLAKALLAKPGEDRARDALALASAVSHSGPKGRGADEAEDIERDAAGRLPKEERSKITDPTDADRADKAESLVLSNQHKRALAILDRLTKKTSLAADVACKVSYARGRALGGVKRTGEGLDELTRAATLCEKQPEYPEVLFAAGRAAQKADAYDRARTFFGKLEAAAPTHRLADDARFEGARCALEAGDRGAFGKMLDTMPTDYPSGDVTGDGIFLRAIEAMERGAYAEAKKPLGQGAARPRERAYYRAGRFSYFLGRAELAAGDRDEARAWLARTISEYPLGYYAALAVVQLEKLERGSGRAALASTLAGDPGSAPPELPESAKDDAVVKAAIAVARAGDPRGIDDVLSSYGVRERTAEASQLLFAARLYGIAGDARRAHGVLRTASEIESRTGRTELDAMREEAPRGAWRAVWELAYPRLFASEVSGASVESGVPEPLLYAIMREESAFAPDAVSVSDARGLFQVIPATGAKMARGLGIRMKADTLFDPASSARIGARYLSGLRNRFATAPLLCIPGYNAGPGAPEAWLADRPGWDFDLWVERIPYAETRGYTKRVLASLFTYEVLYGEGVAETSSIPIRL